MKCWACLLHKGFDTVQLFAEKPFPGEYNWFKAKRSRTRKDLADEFGWIGKEEFEKEFGFLPEYGKPMLVDVTIKEPA